MQKNGGTYAQIFHRVGLVFFFIIISFFHILFIFFVRKLEGGEKKFQGNLFPLRLEFNDSLFQKHKG